MSSLLRKECVDAPDRTAPPALTTYLRIWNALSKRRGLIAGKLNGPNGEHCAMGQMWSEHPTDAVKYVILDEIAAINDFKPSETKFQRWQRVRKYLRHKLRRKYGVDV